MSNVIRHKMPATIPDDMLLFSGFALAHAAYSICDVPEGQLLIPLFISENGGKREVLRFEAENQESAISSAKQHIHAIDGTLDLWAFMREGSLALSEETQVDVILLDASSAQFGHRITVVQPFRPSRRPDGFMLLGEPIVALDGKELNSEQLLWCIQILDEGFSMHPAASEVARGGASPMRG